MSSTNLFLNIDSYSERNNEYFPDNTSAKFKIHLEEPLYLSGTWKMALTDICIKDSNKIAYMDHLYVFCNMAGESVINGERRQCLLRKIQFVKKGNWTHTFNLPYYVDVTKTQIFDIEFYITDKNFDLVSFLKKTVSLTVHLRQYPFFT